MLLCINHGLVRWLGWELEPAQPHHLKQHHEPLGQWSSKCGLCINNFNITWEHIKNASS